MVKAPFEVRSIPVPIKSGQAAGDKLYVVPLRFTKVKFLGDIKSRIGNYYKFESAAQFVGILSYIAGKITYRAAGL